MSLIGVISDKINNLTIVKAYRTLSALEAQSIDVDARLLLTRQKLHDLVNCAEYTDFLEKTEEVKKEVDVVKSVIKDLRREEEINKKLSNTLAHYRV